MGSGKQPEFNPIGKSFVDLRLEAERAFNAGEYENVIRLMNYALTLNLTRQQAAFLTTARGAAYGAKNEPDKALKDFDTALELNPAAAETYRYRGIALLNKGDFDAALKDFNEAIRFEPEKWLPYLKRAETLASLHQWDAELKELEKVLQLNPKCAPAYADRAVVELRRKDHGHALEDAHKAIECDPNFYGGYYARARAYIGLKKFTEADRDLRALLSLKMKNKSGPLNDVAWIRATCPEPSLRNGKVAISLATNACDLTDWKNPKYIDTLAAAYAEAGDFDSATKFQQRALDLAEDTAPPNIVDLRARLTLYQKQQPYRDNRDETTP